MAAFDLAVSEGADGVELDVRLGGGFDVVVLHDRSLARMTDNSDHRDIELLDAAELSGVDVGQGEQIPRLDQVLRWAVARDVRVNIEVKPDVSEPRMLVRRVAALVRQVPDAPVRLLLSSLNPDLLLQMAQLLPELPLAWVVIEGTRLAQCEAQLAQLGRVGINPHQSIVTLELMRAARQHGRAVYAWTVNDADQAHRLCDLGADGLITDDPARIASLFR